MRLLEALRTHTRHPHDALHTHPLLIGLSADQTDGREITLRDFHHILLAFDAYYAHAEAACVVQWPLDTADQAPNAPVLSWLASDLAQHQLDSWANRIAFQHSPIDTPSKLAGYLYTKQGSTLGGHVISKHLERRLALIPRLDQWFFAGYGSHNGAQWKLFLDVLDRHSEALSHGEVIQSAKQAFDNITYFCDTIYNMIKTETLYEA
ncbi:hypothetical protein AEAC466_17590 [Asticcacaulis sp. AC466]|uniref:biliverdin-producing heme oxygenase n=1 Tax=Asticcacaulis sp. AC466 TaxID=1282362 RepID=UPI0003C3FC20|nr:biliverdin-producing heme oxygenase [Asticcacaulis sp. AC466]ESQ82434.1 hypothetical protein AEAC466_17590 [Asticcacaulis sp. AC466]